MNFVYVPLTGEFTRVLRSLEVTTNSGKFHHYQYSVCLLKVPELEVFLYKFDLIDKSCAVAKKLDISQLQTFPHSVIAFLRYSAVLHCISTRHCLLIMLNSWTVLNFLMVYYRGILGWTSRRLPQDTPKNLTCRVRLIPQNKSVVFVANSTARTCRELP